jgi:hypothetical protein
MTSALISSLAEKQERSFQRRTSKFIAMSGRELMQIKGWLKNGNTLSDPRNLPAHKEPLLKITEAESLTHDPAFQPSIHSGETYIKSKDLCLEWKDFLVLILYLLEYRSYLPDGGYADSRNR